MDGLGYNQVSGITTCHPIYFDSCKSEHGCGTWCRLPFLDRCFSLNVSSQNTVFPPKVLGRFKIFLQEFFCVLGWFHEFPAQKTIHLKFKKKTLCVPVFFFGVLLLTPASDTDRSTLNLRRLSSKIRTSIIRFFWRTSIPAASCHGFKSRRLVS